MYFSITQVQKTPLHVAATKDHIEYVAQLVNSGADISVKDKVS